MTDSLSKQKKKPETTPSQPRLRFWKVQSIGNDFVLFHEREVVKLVGSKRLESFLPKLAVLSCERRFGVGSDGLLLLGHKDKRLILRMFNPDGTEDFCGNGLRCAALHGHQMGWVSSHFSILHGGQSIETEIGADGSVRTMLEKPSYDPQKVPVRSERELFKTTVWNGMIDGQPLNIYGSALTTGSTHVVVATAALPDDESFVAISSAIEKDPRYPKHTSVIWVREDGPSELSLRIWERGVGETQGCGTGSTAAAADYMRRRQLSGPITVHNPGGTVVVHGGSWQEKLQLEGIAHVVYSGDYFVPHGVL